MDSVYFHSSYGQQISLLNLPNEILEQIMANMSYEEIAQHRLVKYRLQVYETCLIRF